MNARSKLGIGALTCVLTVAGSPALWAANPNGNGNNVSQVLSHAIGNQYANPSAALGSAIYPLEFRTIDGTGNNIANPSWGSANVELLRTTAIDYADGVSAPGGVGRASAREISNLVVAQPGSILNPVKGSDFIWQWGQFVDHDLDLSPGASPVEEFEIEVPLGDPFFDPFSTGTQVIPLERSAFNVVAGVRQQINVLTAYIDASNVYGSDGARALELRTLDGTGRLKTSAGDLLPFNVNGFPNAPNASPAFFLAGDVRANEQVGLTAMHTLFVREHNYWASMIHAEMPALTDEEVYQNARAIVAAEMQAITYNEFLPVVLGKNVVGKYKGYQPDVDAGIANVFATASYRFGHSMLSPQLLRLDGNNDPIPGGPLSLAGSFFNPAEISTNGIDPLLRGLANQKAQNVDAFIVDEVRNFLFGPPGAGGFDLASLNIQRGREHGLPSFNQVRVAYGLPAYTSFAEVNSDPAIQARLAAAYATVDDIDAWVGGLAENRAPGALVGKTLRRVLGDQFTRLRDGDRFYYESYMPQPLVAMINQQTLSEIIRRNTGIGNELQNNAFKVQGN